MAARRIAYPFLTLPDEVVGFGGWMAGASGEPLSEVQDLIHAWDYERDLEVRTRVDIDHEGAAESLSINPERFSVLAVLRIGTGKGGLPQKLFRLDSGSLSRSNPELSLGGIVRGWRLSARLWLELDLLFENGEPGSSLSPTSVGSRLWSSRTDLLLEDGGDSRFPIELASFEKAFRGASFESAPWYLDWRPGRIDEDFSGAVRLFVNSDREDTADAVVRGEESALETILGGVVVQLVRGTLAIDEAPELLPEAPDGSIGQQVRNWIELAFPDQSIESVRALMDSMPGRFDASLLSAVRLGEDG